MSLTVIIPCYNEELIIEDTVNYLNKNINNIDHEIILIDDFSNDKTLNILNDLSTKYKNIKIFKNKKKGLGGAINLGIEKTKFNYVAILMADMSDDVNDLIKYYEIISKENLDSVLGSRFLKNSTVENYPQIKLFLNRIFNNIVKVLFLVNYNDFTNAFKIYKIETLKKLTPLVSENFNIFLEIPLKIISRGYSYKIIPINWKNRTKGEAKFRIRELSSKYLFTLFYCFLEKILLKKKNK